MAEKTFSKEMNATIGTMMYGGRNSEGKQYFGLFALYAHRQQSSGYNLVTEDKLRIVLISMSSISDLSTDGKVEIDAAAIQFDTVASIQNSSEF